MRYDQIMSDIIETMKSDYAGFEEKQQYHDTHTYVRACGQAYKDHTLTPLYFLQLINQYLACFQDRNLQFTLDESEEYQKCSSGFHTRRHGDILYVTEVTKESRVVPGDRILCLNTLSPGIHRKRLTNNLFGSEIPEREFWSGFLKMVNHCMVEHADGTTEDIILKKYPKDSLKDTIELKLLNENTYYAKIESFREPDRILQLANDLIGRCDEQSRYHKLIIDLRSCSGGYESAFYPLLPLILSKPKPLLELLDTPNLVTNYSHNNCALLTASLNALRQQIVEQADTSSDLNKIKKATVFIDEMIQELDKKSGKGYLTEPDESVQEIDYLIPAKRIADQIILLTDTYCEGAAEHFILACRNAENVTVVGRPSLGTLDYCGLVSKRYEGGFTLTYPTAKTQRAADGNGYGKNGIPVDRYIAWSPAECSEDIILKTAMELE